MSVEEVISNDWAASQTLTALVDANHVYVGKPPINDTTGTNLGFNDVAILVKSADEVWRDSEGLVGFNEKLTFFIVTDNTSTAGAYDYARQIDEAIVEHYNGFAQEAAEVNVLDMRPMNRTENENQDDGVWEITRDFTVNAYITQGQTIG